MLLIVIKNIIPLCTYLQRLLFLCACTCVAIVKVIGSSPIVFCIKEKNTTAHGNVLFGGSFRNGDPLLELRGASLRS